MTNPSRKVADATDSAPTLLDLFCGAGGAATGYHRAGFSIIGIDINPQPNYPYEFIQADALKIDLPGCDVIHASPECQGYCWSTTAARNAGKVYSDDIPEVRELLIESGKPYIIENVPTAPLINPTYLEGTMFGLGVLRRRGFETNWRLPQPKFRRRKKPITRPHKFTGKMIQKSAYCQVTTSGSDGWSCRLSDWQEAMGIDWMTREEIKQAIPPAYTEYIGRYAIRMGGND